MRVFKFILGVCSLLLFSSCASLQPVVVSRNSSLDDYRYVYITPTSELTASAGVVYGGSYGVYGATQDSRVNPSEVIAGNMIKKGFIQVSEIIPELADQTLIVNYGESGRRDVLWGYTIEITLQFLSAQTHEVVCISTAEGMGSTEADDIRIAINRALEEVFSI